MGKILDWFNNLMSRQESIEQASNFGAVEAENSQFATGQLGIQQGMNNLNLSENELKPINVELVLPISVPVGFQFSESETLRVYFSMDYSTLRLAEETLEVPDQVTFTDEDEEHTLQCMVPVGKYFAEGILFYNMVFSGAEPIQFMDATVKRGDTKYQSTTGISYYDKLVINQKLGYGCPYQKIDEDFVFNVTIRTPYVINEAGEKIKLELAISGNELELSEAKCYGAYTGSPYLVSNTGATSLYVPCEIIIENVQQPS